MTLLASGHFLLYAFDLLEKIYQEWNEEVAAEVAAASRRFEDQSRDGSATSSSTIPPNMIPKLIIEKNLHGIDIDPRAVQIAAVKLPPVHLKEGSDGIRRDIEKLGVFERMTDDRVNLPDVYRVGYGLGRKGGVKAEALNNATKRRMLKRKQAPEIYLPVS